MASTTKLPGTLNPDADALHPASVTAAAHPIDPEPLTTWVLSDGKPGHENQSRGVAEALSFATEIKRIKPGVISRSLAPWGPAGFADRVGRAGSRFGPPWPTFVIATGRQTIPYLRSIKRRAGPATFATILMDPKTADSAADLIWLPEHDRRRSANILTTPVAPHAYSDERLIALRAETPADIRRLPHPRLAVLIGGPNGDYGFTRADIDRLVAALRSLSRSGAGLMITPSRRTPAVLAEALRELAQLDNVILWAGHGENPYPYFLANADAFVITADSVSMTCEAAATGRPIHIFQPSGGGAKFARFHTRLHALGVTRPLDVVDAPVAILENWSYAPLNAAPVIAAEILARWQARRARLAGQEV